MAVKLEDSRAVPGLDNPAGSAHSIAKTFDTISVKTFAEFLNPLTPITNPALDEKLRMPVTFDPLIAC